MVLYSSTNFPILKPWAIVSNLIRFDLGFSPSSKPFYRKFKYREKVLEVFECLPRFPRKMVLYSSTNFPILRPLAIISNLIRFNLGFWQASKPFKRKRKYRENVLEDFQGLPRFAGKMVFYSSTNFRILKPSAMISNLIRFDLGLWKASKPLFRKLKYRENVLEDFQRLPRFPRKMVFYSSTNFRILKPSAIISNLIRFDFSFWQDSKPFYRKLKYWEKHLQGFQRLPRFPRKIVFYSSSNFRILKQWAIISNLIRFDLGFWPAWKAFHGKLKYREKVLEEFQRLNRFSRKLVLCSTTNIPILRSWAIICNLKRLDLGFWQASKPFYSKLKYWEKV